MVKKKFIDKKKSVTYSLVYRSTEDADAPPERTLMEAGRGADAAQPDVEAAAEAHTAATTVRRYPPGHPLAWIEDQELQGEISDERRKELVELGFPDDGYDYIRHMRTLGVGAASLEGLEGKNSQEEGGPSAASEAAEAALQATRVETTTAILGGKGPAKIKETGPVGPSVFMKATAVQQPEADVAVFDAAGLTVLQPADKDEEATEMMGGVSAFSRRKDAEELGAERRDIEELEELMRALEADDDLDVLEEEEEEKKEEEKSEKISSAANSAAARDDSRKAKDGVRVKGRVLGEGDLLDDFILTATQGPNNKRGKKNAAAAYDDNDEEDDDEADWSSVEEYEEEDDESDDELEGSVVNIKGKPPPRPGSIASTYWREERTDRKNLLGAIDERFEQLALEYDEDEIGSMEDEADAGEIQGFADVSDFDAILNQFLEERKASRGGADVDEDFEEEEEEENLEEEGGGLRNAGGEEGFEEKEGSEEQQKAAKKPVTRRRRGESILKARLEAAGFDDADAEVAITAARAAIRRMEEEEALGINTGVDVEIRKKEVDPTAGWDCESVLSLRSNLYNHPGTITEPGRRKAPPTGVIRLNKDGMPMGILPRMYGQQQRQQNGEEGDEDGLAVEVEMKKASAVVFERKKGESAEEKRARKNAVKEAKRDARATKKELKTLYKEETVKAHKRAATAQVQPSVLL